MKKSFSFFLLLFILCSCHDKYDRQLDRIEMLIESDPKMALEKLDSFPSHELSINRDKARYALLKSIALNKNYIDVSDDSLTSIALAYYQKNGGPLDRTKALYYHAVVKKNSGNYIDAILLLEEAEQYGNRANDDYYIGLINRLKADLFNLTNNNIGAIDCIQKAISSFESSQKTAFAEYELIALSTAYINNRQFDKARKVLDSIKENENLSKRYAYQIALNEAILSGEQGEWDCARQVFETIPFDYYSLVDFCYYATALAQTDSPDGADNLLRAVVQAYHDPLNLATVDYVSAKILFEEGRYSEAYHCLNRATTVQDSLTRSLLEQSLSCAQRDYYKKEKEIEERRRITERERWYFLVALIVLSMSFLLYIFAKKSRERKNMLQDQMARMAENTNNLMLLQQEHAEIVGSLFSQRLHQLDRLSSDYYDSDDEKKKEILFNSFKAEIRHFSSDKKVLASLEEDLNKYCGNVMEKLALQVPHIKGENRVIISMFFAGIDYDTIRLLLHRNSVQSLKTLKSRLKAEIIQSGAKDAELFVEMLKRKRAETDN